MKESDGNEEQRIKIIKKAIKKYGSVNIAMLVYPSFMTYSSGIYHTTANERNGTVDPIGGHAVKIIGWGK